MSGTEFEGYEALVSELRADPPVAPARLRQRVLEGAPAAGRLIRGMVLASFTFAVFFLVLAERLDRWGTAAAFGVGTALALVMHGALLAAPSARAAHPSSTR